MALRRAGLGNNTIWAGAGVLLQAPGAGCASSLVFPVESSFVVVGYDALHGGFEGAFVKGTGWDAWGTWFGGGSLQGKGEDGERGLEMFWNGTAFLGGSSTFVYAHASAWSSSPSLIAPRLRKRNATSMLPLSIASNSLVCSAADKGIQYVLLDVKVLAVIFYFSVS